MSEIVDKNPTPDSIAVAASSVEAPSYTQKRSFGQLLRGDLGFIPVLLTLIVVALYFEITSHGLFFTPGNISNLLQEAIGIGIAALAVTFVLLLGEIDLSVAAVSTLCAVIMGVLSERFHFPAVGAILIGILAGALVGAINGFFIAVLRIPSFIVTLAASIAYSGLLITFLNGQATLIIGDPFILSIAGSARSFLPDILGVGLPTLAVIIYAVVILSEQAQRRRAGLRTKSLVQLIVQIGLVAIVVEGVVAILENTPSPTPGIFLGVPNAVAILFGLILLFWIVLTKTRFGRHVYAVGGNAEAARRAGINVTFIRIAAFTLCSALAAVGGVLAASYGNAVASQVSPTLLLEAIGAAVIGGISLFGGKGSIWAIVLGTLIIGSLGNGLALLNQTADVRQIVEGIVLLLAVTIDAIIRRIQAASKSGR
ncbi:MAG: ABC transporter permease [Ktedonobacteraceae bacterium]